MRLRVFARAANSTRPVDPDSPPAACPPAQGSVVARLQRFATYGSLKQLVLRMITEDMRRSGATPTLAAAMQARGAGALFLLGGLSGAVPPLHACPTPRRNTPPWLKSHPSNQSHPGPNALPPNATNAMTPHPLPTPPPTPPPPPPTKTPQELFREYDSDASGSISFEELTDGLRRQGYAVIESEARDPGVEGSGIDVPG
jgi:hypothetical protein